MFWNKKKTALKMPEPTEAQLQEEAAFVARGPSKRTTTGETTQILRLTFANVDKAIEEKRTTKEAAKRLQESVAKVGATLHLKKI